METIYKELEMFFHEFFLLQLFLGSIVYTIGGCCRFLWFKRRWHKVTFLSFGLVLTALVVSVFLSLFFWIAIPCKYLPWGDVMVFEFISVPAVLSELCLFFVQFVIFKIIDIRKNV